MWIIHASIIKPVQVGKVWCKVTAGRVETFHGWEITWAGCRLTALLCRPLHWSINAAAAGTLPELQ